jgi:hypothetical protein
MKKNYNILSMHYFASNKNFKLKKWLQFCWLSKERMDPCYSHLMSSYSFKFGRCVSTFSYTAKLSFCSIWCYEHWYFHLIVLSQTMWAEIKICEGGRNLPSTCLVERHVVCAKRNHVSLPCWCKLLSKVWFSFDPRYLNC